MSEWIVCPNCLKKAEQGAESCPHCGQSMKNQNPRGALAYGSLLAGRYTVGEFLRADGEGILYRAVENNAAVRVTIKEYLPVTLAADRDAEGSVNPKAGSEVLYKTTRMDFVDLYQELLKLTPATGLETVLDVFEANNTAYAVMENPGGIPLDEYLASAGGRIAPADARSMLQPVFEGVAAMHAVGLVHRGVSPENIRVQENGKARLSGYATLGLRTAGSALRPQLYEGYAAPEQYSSAEFEGRYTDAYALAAVFYRMVTGQAPLSAAQRMVSDSNPTARSLEAGIPGWLSEVLAHGMALRPAERIQTVPMLMSSLTSPAAAEALTGEEKKREQQKRKTASLLAALILLAAVLCLVVLWLVLGRGNGKPADPAASASSVPAVTETEYVPDFVGMTYTQIQTSGQYAGHFRFYLTEGYDDTAPAGTIIGQTPEANTPITSDEQRSITLVVSVGPESIVVPSVFGYTQAAAVQEIEALGLKTVSVMVANDGSYAAGCVVQTDPADGTAVEPGSTVTLYIAADRDVVIPDPTASPEPTATPDLSVDGANPDEMEGFD